MCQLSESRWNRGITLGPLWARRPDGVTLMLQPMWGRHETDVATDAYDNPALSGAMNVELEGHVWGGLQVWGQSVLKWVCWVLNDSSEMRKNYSVALICSNRKLRVQAESSFDSKTLSNNQKNYVNTPRSILFSETVFQQALAGNTLRLTLTFLGQILCHQTCLRKAEEKRRRNIWTGKKKSVQRVFASKWMQTKLMFVFLSLARDKVFS